jgi:uncharacterized protein (TIGR02118 family)
MVRVHIWLRKRDDLSEEEFRRHWIEDHAPIARNGYQYLTGYRIDLVTRVPSGQEAPYDGIAVLTWDDRDSMKADLASEAARLATEDLATFTSANGFLYVEEDVVK